MPYANPATQRAYNRQWKAARRMQWFADKVCEFCGTAENLRLDHSGPSAESLSPDLDFGRPHVGMPR